MTINDERYKDVLLGKPLYTFGTKTHESRLSIFSSPDGTKVYELAASGGALSDVGGSNLLLSAYAIRRDMTFDKPIDLSMNMKLSAAHISAPPTAVQSGAVLAQVISGFTLLFTDPKTNAKTTVFMQIEHANSRNNFGDYRGCYPHGNNTEITIDKVFDDEYRMSFVASAGAPTHATYNLNRHLCALITEPLSCRQPDGSTKPFVFPEEARDLRNWRLTSMYTGLETEDRDARAPVSTPTKQGDVNVGFQISNLRVMFDPSRTGASCNNN